MNNFIVFGRRKSKPIKKLRHKKNLDAELADKTIFYCTECRRCYEPSRVNWHNRTEYYEDFVSYGKPRKICKKCKPDKSANAQKQDDIGLVDATMSGLNRYWYLTKDGDEYCMDLFKKHYSHRPYADGRETKLFCGPGEKIVLRTWECDAMFVWRKYINDAGEEGINCSIFRNESKTKSSTLIQQADEIAFAVWSDRRHYTYVNAEKIKSANPGYCFKKAGWRECGMTKVNKHIILEKYENA